MEDKIRDAIDSLKKVEDAINTFNSAEGEAKEAMASTNESENLEEQSSEEEFKEVIDNLLERLTGYRYYNLPYYVIKRSENESSETDTEDDEVSETEVRGNTSGTIDEAKVDYDFSERELIRVLRQLKRGASTEVDMIKAFTKALGRDLTKDELFSESIAKINEATEEMTMKELITRIEELEKGKFSNENARELKDLRAELSYRQNFKNESLNEALNPEVSNALKQRDFDGVNEAIDVVENQLELFPKEDKPKGLDYSKVISKISPKEVETIITNMGSKGWVLKKAIEVIEKGDDKVSYKELRKMLDMTKPVNEVKDLENTNNLTNIVESKNIKIKKSHIINFIKERK